MPSRKNRSKQTLRGGRRKSKRRRITSKTKGGRHGKITYCCSKKKSNGIVNGKENRGTNCEKAYTSQCYPNQYKFRCSIKDGTKPPDFVNNIAEKGSGFSSLFPNCEYITSTPAKFFKATVGQIVSQYQGDEEKLEKERRDWRDKHTAKYKLIDENGTAQEAEAKAEAEAEAESRSQSRSRSRSQSNSNRRIIEE